MKTFSLKKEQIKKKWLLIDAEKAVLGRLAVISARILRGKNKSLFRRIYLTDTNKREFIPGSLKT